VLIQKLQLWFHILHIYDVVNVTATYQPVVWVCGVPHSGTEKKDNVAFSAGSSVIASLVGSLTERLIRVATDVKLQALP
jgi:hypothetical protein